MYTPTRPHIARLQEYERKRAKVLAVADKTIDYTFKAVLAGLVYVVLVGVTA